MNFQEFREKYRSDEPRRLYSTPMSRRLFRDNSRYLYLVPNENEVPNISHKLRELPESDALYGIIGGVDAVLEYFSIESEKNPSLRALLVDVNEDALDYLCFLIHSMRGIKREDPEDNAPKYFFNVWNNEPDDRSVEEIFGRDSEGRLPDLEIFHKKKDVIAGELAKYYQKRRRNWLKEPEKIVEAVQEGRIRAFRADMFDKGIDTAVEVLDGVERLTLYTSNIHGVNIPLNRLVRDLDLKQATWIDNRDARFFTESSLSSSSGTESRP